VRVRVCVCVGWAGLVGELELPLPYVVNGAPLLVYF